MSVTKRNNQRLNVALELYFLIMLLSIITFLALALIKGISIFVYAGLVVTILFLKGLADGLLDMVKDYYITHEL